MAAAFAKAALAFAGFVLFPFLVIATAASALMLFDRIAHGHQKHGYHLSR